MYFSKDLSIKIRKITAKTTKDNSNVTPCNNGTKVFSIVSATILKSLGFRSSLLLTT